MTNDCIDANNWRGLVTEVADEARVWIDDVLLQTEFGVDVTLSSVEPTAPDLRNKSIIIPGMAGAYDAGADLQPREFQLDCVFPRQSYSDLKSESRRLTALFFDQFGKSRTFKLRMGDEPLKYYNVRLTSGIEISRSNNRGHFSVMLTAFDPYAYSVITNDEVVWGSEIITFRSREYLLGHDSMGGSSGVRITRPTMETISVMGYAVKPTILINGSASRLTIEANGNNIVLPAFSNASWAIDSEKYTVTKDGKNVFGDVTLGEFWFKKGNNDVRVSGSNIDVDLQIVFRDRWI